MDFTYSEEQRMLADSLRRFVESEYTFAARRTRSRAQSGFDRDVWTSLADMGVLGLTVPAEYGGFGEGPASRLAVQRELGRGLVVEPVIPAAVCAAAVLARFGTPVQKDRWLTALAGGGKIVTLAWQEPASRYRPESVRTVATRSADGYVLNGSKSLVWHGEIADALIVSAQLADSGQLGLFLVPRDVVGLTLKGYPTMDGLRAADFAFTNVTLRADALIGNAGDGQTALEHALDHGIAALCAEAAGAMERLIEITSEYLRTRKQFGVPLASFQALQHRVAEMLVQKELAMSMAYVAAQALDEPDAVQRTRRVSAAKVVVARAGRFVGQQAVQLHGGMGMTDELEVGDYFKRLTMVDVMFGDSDYHLGRYCTHMQNQAVRQAT
jgi:alkylation response protein AidB-like acyl-CoA dehydrogenase